MSAAAYAFRGFRILFSRLSPAQRIPERARDRGDDGSTVALHRSGGDTWPRVIGIEAQPPA